MATHKVAVILENPSNHDEFLLVKQLRPPKFDDEEYDSYFDSDLWDLPSAQLHPLIGELESQIVVEVAESHLEQIDIDLRKFNILSAFNEVLIKFTVCKERVPNFK